MSLTTIENNNQKNIQYYYLLILYVYNELFFPLFLINITNQINMHQYTYILYKTTVGFKFILTLNNCPSNKC